jgi:3-mercaptopyruvate sulfurtransferase SseA
MWISRGWLELKFPAHYPHRDQAIAVACPDGRQSLLAAQTLQEMGYRSVAAVEGGVRAWTAAGLPTANGSENQLVQPNDVVVSPSIRGTKEDMRRYLDWELRLGK